MKTKFKRSRTDTFWDVLFLGVVIGLVTLSLHIASGDQPSQGGSRYEYRYE